MFLSFAHFGALEMPDFQGNLLQCRGDQSEHAQIMGVTIALNHLRCNGCDLQAQALADLLLDFGAKMRSIPDCAGNFPDCHFARGFTEARDIALVLGEPIGDLEAKRNGFGVNAVSAADLWRVLKLVSPDIEDFAEHHEVALDDMRSIANL